MQCELVSLQYEEGSSYSIFINFDFCNYSFDAPLSWMPEAITLRLSPSLHATGNELAIWGGYYFSRLQVYKINVY